MTDPWATPVDPTAAVEPLDPAVALLGPEWAGWTVVKWPGDKLPPKEGEFGYRGPKAVYVDRVTGELIGVPPRREPRAMVLHNDACRDAGPWPAEPVDCPACSAASAN